LDLLVKHEVTVLRSDYHQLSPGWFAKPVLQAPGALRFGLFDIPASVRLPGESRWKPGGGGRRRSRTGIEAAIAHQSVFHVQVDAISLIERGPMAEHALDYVLRHAMRRCDDGVLEVTSLAVAVRKIAGDKAAVPARSILHSAA
jgi:hypothetical protein